MKSITSVRAALALCLFGAALAFPVSSGRAAAEDKAALAASRSEIAAAFRSLPADTAEDLQSDIKYMRSLSQPNQAYINDLSDDRQLNFTLRNLRRAGKTPETAPQLFASLAAARAHHKLNPPAHSLKAAVGEDQRASLNSIVALGQVSTSSLKANEKGSATNASAVPAYSGTGLSSIPNGTIFTVMTIQLYNAQTDAPFGPGNQNQQTGGGENLTVTQTSTPPAAISDVGALLQVNYQQNGTTDPVTVTYQTSVNGMPLTPPVVTAPVHVYKTPPNPYIKVCLSRNSTPDPNCDYGPYQAPSPNPLVQLPVTGNITFSANVDTTRNVSGTMVVWAQNGGGSCTLSLDPTQFAQAFSVSGTNPAQSLWQFFHTEGGTRVNTASFGILNNNPCWLPDQNFGMTLDVNVPIQGVIAPQEFYVTTVPGPSLGNVTRIDPLHFTWGCFEAGTKVLMADGSTKAIEEVAVGDALIADASGRHLTVREMTKGTEAEPMVVVTDERGQTLSVTGGHAVVTLDAAGKPKVVLAKQLKEGAVIYSSDMSLDRNGKPAHPRPSKIVKIERPHYDGYVYNVYLGLKEKGEQFDRGNTTLIAEGIMTGDNGMQEYFGADFNFRPVNVRDRLPPEWRRDYDNYLKQQQQQARSY